LHKQGIHTHKLRPFADVQKYIQMLEKPNRILWQKPDEIIKALNLKGHEVIADVGAGSGYFTFRFAKKLPHGKVFAIDIEPEMLRHIHHNAMRKGFHNIHVILSKPDDPKIPPRVDWVFICDVLHHIEKRTVWLTRLFRSLPSGAKVVVIEFKTGKLPQGPPESIKLPKVQIIAMFRGAGFHYLAERPKLLPYQEFLWFQKR
jgi:ubiquinone/menaquinone biosynthesis C-methylase UbiE